MIAFHIDRRYRSLPLESALKKAAEIALHHEGAPVGAELSLVIATDAKLQKLNRDFRGERGATDVLSFPSDENDKETGQRYLGDVVISLPRARVQAKAAGHPLEVELQLLTVHGVLHLFGHDHEALGERTRMWTAQDEILKQLGLSIKSTKAEALHS